MLGKIIGAIAGERVAKHIGGVNGPAGAALGIGAAALLRRLGPVGLVAAAVGSYALKRHLDKRQDVSPGRPATGQKRSRAKA